MSAVKKTMRLGQNPARELTEDVFAINSLGEDVQKAHEKIQQLEALKLKVIEQNPEVLTYVPPTEEEEVEDVQLSAQGVTDVFKFLDTEVISKIVTLFETTDNGDVFLNLRIKIKDGKPNN